MLESRGGGKGESNGTRRVPGLSVYPASTRREDRAARVARDAPSFPRGDVPQPSATTPPLFSPRPNILNIQRTMTFCWPPATAVCINDVAPSPLLGGGSDVAGRMGADCFSLPSVDFLFAPSWLFCSPLRSSRGEGEQ